MQSRNPMHIAVAALAGLSAAAPMRMRYLGSSSLHVTEACLGTMTFGVQNSEAEAHEQLDYALKKRGINMVDTAEMYPVPSSDQGGSLAARKKSSGRGSLRTQPGVRRSSSPPRFLATGPSRKSRLSAAVTAASTERRSLPPAKAR